MSETRQEFLARVAELHDQWVKKHEETTTYDPEARPGSEDYNLWYVDMDASPEAQQEFFDAVGEPPAGDDDPVGDEESEDVTTTFDDDE